VFLVENGTRRHIASAEIFDQQSYDWEDVIEVTEQISNLIPSITVLVANFIHGNTNIFRSRVYLWNPSTRAGDITVRVFTMPRPAPSDPPEPSQLLGTVPLGTLEAESARTIRIEEVLSDPLVTITQPYTENGGNLMLEFTIEAAGVRGTAQVFDNSFTLAFGTYPLQEISSTSNVSPTVLVANFIHGNTNIFRSRVYLWNPSTRFGAITVRVFTMPRPAPFEPPEPSQLLGTLPLGTLEARSARTIRIEEVLADPLVTITQPYEENGGNLMLEFTIEAAGVRGAAQVFDNSFTLAFGTYPLQETVPVQSLQGQVSEYQLTQSTRLGAPLGEWFLLPQISDSGGTVVFESNVPPLGGAAENRYQVYAYDRLTEGFSQITSFEEYDSFLPTITGDDAKVSYYTSQSKIFITDTKGPSHTLITERGSFLESINSARISSNGEKIVFRLVEALGQIS